MSTETPYVRIERTDGIASIEFFHPQSNSMPGEQLQRLATAFDELGSDPSVRVVVLRSAGERAFCGGASFDELIAIADEAQGLAFFSGFARVILAMRRCPKFVVAVVQGRCVGGGVGLAASADYCLALQTASVKLSELAVGIGPFVVGPAVERKVGVSGFSELAIDAASWRDAEWARSRGLFNALFATREELEAEVDRLTSSLNQSNPDAMSALKQVLWFGTDHWDTLLYERAAISGRLVLSDFTRQAIARFKAS
jgi:methylglutaconyl-CoA hydratase